MAFNLIPNFENWNDEAVALQCPNCHESALHHDQVTTFFRRCDDQHALKVVASDGGKLESSIAETNPRSDHIPGNPSDRRDGMTIRFWCEHCSEGEDGNTPVYFYLDIAQHKGHTVVKFRR